METDGQPLESVMEPLVLIEGKNTEDKQMENSSLKPCDNRHLGLNRPKAISQVHFSAKDMGYPKNPFKMPTDSDIFELREKERIAKKQERMKQKKLKVHEKMTYTQKIKSRLRMVTKPDTADEDEEQLPSVKDDPQFTIAITKDRRIEKETISEYISKKREMFRVQYAIGVMRHEMRKLDEIAQAEERKLEMAEQYLEEDASMFDEFLKENDKNSVEAIKIAEQETKEKLEKVAEIKKINASIMSLKSEISKSEDTLKEYKLYRNFLEKLAPVEWQQKIQKKREGKRREKKDESITDEDDSKSKHLGSPKKMLTSPKLISDTESISSNVDFTDSDSDEELELFFTDPQQVLDIFAELEEQNLSLIQNSQETEETLEEIKQSFEANRLKMEKETSLLKDQIEKMKAKIKREEERSADLEMKVKMFSISGEMQSVDQQTMLEELNNKVEEVYRGIIGRNEANIDTLQMLTNIENRLEELFELEESMPPDKVDAAKRAKEKERRLKMREEKLKLQKLHQEERIKKSLERAKAEPKKVLGKKLMRRSDPPRLKKKQDKKLDQATREEEELAYFFTE